MFDTPEVGTVSSNTDISLSPSCLTGPGARGAGTRCPWESSGRQGRSAPGDLA